MAGDVDRGLHLDDRPAGSHLLRTGDYTQNGTVSEIAISQELGAIAPNRFILALGAWPANSLDEKWRFNAN